MTEDKLTKDQAKAEYRALIARYGLQWTPARVPDRSAWDRLTEINTVLDEQDRREALGWRRMRPT
jgi:hypothetical protein